MVYGIAVRTSRKIVPDAEYVNGLKAIGRTAKVMGSRRSGQCRLSVTNGSALTLATALSRSKMSTHPSLRYAACHCQG